MDDEVNRRDPRDESTVRQEAQRILQRLENIDEPYPDFVDWYTGLSLQYGKPSAEAMEFLLDGDFAAFEQLVRDGYQPPLR